MPAGLLKLDCDPELLSFRREPALWRRSRGESTPSHGRHCWRTRAIFYRFCEASGLPIPDLYAIYFRKTPGYCPQGTPLYDPGQWAQFISTRLPPEFVIKPCDSYRGTGVVGFTRTAPEEFLRSDGATMTSRQIVDSLRDSRETQSFVFQQRLRSHPAIAELSQNPHLQTVRITTFVDRRMHCRLLFSHLKLMTRADVFVDNIGDGGTGGLMSMNCLETGTIAKSFLKTQDGTGDRWISHHPITPPGTGWVCGPVLERSLRLWSCRAAHVVPPGPVCRMGCGCHGRRRQVLSRATSGGIGGRLRRQLPGHPPERSRWTGRRARPERGHT